MGASCWLPRGCLSAWTVNSGWKEPRTCQAGPEARRRGRSQPLAKPPLRVLGAWDAAQKDTRDAGQSSRSGTSRGHQVSERRGGTCSQPAPDHTLLPDYQPGGEGLRGPGTQPGPSRSGQVRGLSFLCLVGPADESGGRCGRPGFSESPRGLVTMQTAVLTPSISDTVNPG